MIRLLHDIPHRLAVAVSGGVDSMVALHFLVQQPKREVSVVHFNHGTPGSNEAENMVYAYCRVLNVPFDSRRLDDEIQTVGRSLEDYWREHRYRYFHDIPFPVVTAHHLDDVIETWIFSGLNGTPKLIPYMNKNVFRPFLLTKKVEILAYANAKGVPFFVDDSNFNLRFARNRIRHNIVPEALKVNPGLHKVLAKKIKKEL